MTSLLLGVRFAAAGDRARLIVTSVALAFTVGILLAALGVGPALAAKSQRLDDRSARNSAQPAGAGSAQTLSSPADTYWRGHPLAIRKVTAVRGGVTPPGLAHLPAPGELAVSPSLRDILRGRYSGELTSRLPGRVTAVIGDAGLDGPRELFAYVGVSPTDQRNPQAVTNPEAVTSYGSHRHKDPVPLQIRLAAALGGLALLLPVLVLVSTATRLSAATRDRRLSAVRLVGATPRQASLVAAGEALAFSAIGVVLGVLGFVGLRGTAARLVPLPDGLFGQDLQPRAGTIALVLLGVPVLATLTSLLSLRRVVTSPLGVRRDARVRTAGWVRLVPLAGGLLLLVGARTHARDVSSGTGLGLLLLLGGGGLTIVGLAVAGPAVSRVGGLVLGRLGRGVGSSLASERVAADPGASARVMTGSVLVVFSAAWLLAFLPTLRASQTTSGDLAGRVLPHGTLQAYLAPGSDVERIRRLPGVRHVLSVGQVTLAPQGYRPAPPVDGSTPDPQAPQPVSVPVLSCPDLAAVLGRDLGCTQATAYEVAPGGSSSSGYVEVAQGVPLEVVDEPRTRVAGTIVLPRSLPRLHLTEQEKDSGLINGTVVLSRQALPAALSSRLQTQLTITSDGSAAAVERIRGALPPTSTYSAQTLEEQASQSTATQDSYTRAVTLGLAVAIAVGAASLAVSTADSARERRRSTAAMVAIGVPLRTLRRALLLQMAAPMLTNVLLALGAAAAASTLYLGIYAQGGIARTPLPWLGWSLTGLAAVVAVLVATAATLPLVNAAGRPEALRTE